MLRTCRSARCGSRRPADRRHHSRPPLRRPSHEATRGVHLLRQGEKRRRRRRPESRGPGHASIVWRGKRCIPAVRSRAARPDEQSRKRTTRGDRSSTCRHTPRRRVGGRCRRRSSPRPRAVLQPSGRRRSSILAERARHVRQPVQRTGVVEELAATCSRERDPPSEIATIGVDGRGQAGSTSSTCELRVRSRNRRPSPAISQMSSLPERSLANAIAALRSETTPALRCCRRSR